MKKVLIAVLFCLPLSFMAQNSRVYKEDQSKKGYNVTAPVKYAEVQLMTIKGDAMVKIIFSEENVKELKMSKTLQMDFKTVLDALNAMGKEGYKLVESYSSVNKTGEVVHFIMEKSLVPPRPPRPSKGANSVSGAGRPQVKKK